MAASFVAALAGLSAPAFLSACRPKEALPRPDMAFVEAGSFTMGRDDGPADERPPRLVTLSRDAYVAKAEVTVAEYRAFCEKTGRTAPRPRWDGADRDPVLGVDWYDAVAYCDWLSSEHGLRRCYSGAGTATACDFDASGYRLPTEAEWEWAARGGKNGRGGAYSGGDDPLAVAWFDENSGGRTRAAGSLSPNELGLYDMSGNMYEWCWDFYARDAYAGGDAVDPTGPPPKPLPTPRGPERARRSGSWRESRESIRVDFRSKDYSSYAGDNGFRLWRTAASGAGP